MARDLVSWCAEDGVVVSLLCEVEAVTGVFPLEKAHWESQCVEIP